jgi:hypothetical protein
MTYATVIRPRKLLTKTLFDNSQKTGIPNDFPAHQQSSQLLPVLSIFLLPPSTSDGSIQAVNNCSTLPHIRIHCVDCSRFLVCRYQATNHLASKYCES